MNSLAFPPSGTPPSRELHYQNNPSAFPFLSFFSTTISPYFEILNQLLSFHPEPKKVSQVCRKQGMKGQSNE